MKKILALSICFIGLPLLADIFTYVDTSTLTTNTAASYGQIGFTNGTLVVTNAHYEILRTNNVVVGDDLPIAFGKINTNFMAITNWIGTNNFATGGSGGGADTNLSNISVTATNVIKAIAATAATNAIGNNGGYGTNTTLAANTYIGNGAMDIYSVVFTPTNLIPKMGNSNTPSGLVTSLGGTGNGDTNAFSGSSAFWSEIQTNAWLQYQFASPVTIGGMSAQYSLGYAVSRLAFQYSNDGTNFFSIISSNIMPAGTYFLTNTFPATTASYFRWQFGSPGAYIIKMNYCMIYAANFDIFSNSYPLTISAPTSITLNTGGGVVSINTNGPSIYALNVGGQVSASDMYFVGDSPIFNVLQVSGGTGNATNCNGTYVLGYGGHVFTNTANTYGILLQGAYQVGGTFVAGNNAYTMVTNINSYSTWTNIPVYFNSSLLGQYLPGYGSPTPPPTVSVPVMVGITTNLQFVDATVIGGVLIGSRTNTLYFTNGLLMNVTQP